MLVRSPLLAPLVPPALVVLLLTTTACGARRADPPAIGSASAAIVPHRPEGIGAGPMWTTVASLPRALEVPSSNPLADGRVLVTGGDDGPPYALDVAYSYDFAAGAWSKETPMTTAREFHTASLLAGGDVLVAGGYSDTAPFAATSEVYDPVAKTWTATQLPNERAQHTSTTLANGSVLLAGGYGPGNSGGNIAINSVDLYDPTLGVGGGFGTGSTMNEARASHAACTLNDGTVLVTGGRGSDDTTLADAEIYDLATGAWTMTPTPMNDARESHVCATLPDGTVLVAGGDQLSEGPYMLSTAEVYDPVAKTWTRVGGMAAARAYFQIVPIVGGQFLVVGGDQQNTTLGTTEIYDPVSQSWSAGPTLNEPREVFALTQVANNILVAGGWNSALDNDGIASAEVVNFGAPNGSPCTASPTCASNICTAGICCDTTCTGTCVACTAALKGAGADGTCGPVQAGTDPANQCQDQGAATCGTTGFCDGNSACATYVDGTVCLETSPCIVAVCAGGKCGGPNKLDGSPCPGGVCIAGDCVPDPGAMASSSSSGSTGTGGSSSSSSGVATGGRATTTTTATGGQGGEPSGVSLSGSGCDVGRAGPSPRSATAGLGILVLLGVARARRRRS